MAMHADYSLAVPPPCFLLTGLWRFQRQAGFAARARSTPHHLVHYVERGGYQLRLAGRAWAIEAPALIWYHDAESVIWQGDRRAVAFASVAFVCPGLAPPLAADRVEVASASLSRAFADLFTSASTSDLRGQLRLATVANRWFGLLLDAYGLDAADTLWDRVERRALAVRGVTVAALAAWAGVGVSTVERACRQRHGVSPARRLRSLRLAQADALLAQGGITAGTAALACGWSHRGSLRRARLRSR